jgi:Na+-transporting methylmalonyl-CoA/oxaloacetate decarboxylase gamma subunit
VSGGAADIRDAPPDTFGDVDSRLFRSNVLLIIAGVAVALALLLIVVVVVRTTVKRRARVAVRKRTVSPAVVLRAASRELSSVKAATQQEGWNGDLAGRAAAALRLAGAIALGTPVSQREVERGTAAAEGQIAVGRGLRGKKIVLSSAVTSGTPNGNAASASRSAIWDGISQTLRTFTAVRYSRPSTLRQAEGGNGTPDGTALDAALAEAQDLVKRLWRYQLIRLGKTKTHASEGAKPTWAR